MSLEHFFFSLSDPNTPTAAKKEKKKKEKNSFSWSHLCLENSPRMSLLSVIEFLKTDFFRLEGFYDTFPDSSAVKHFYSLHVQKNDALF